MLNLYSHDSWNHYIHKERYCTQISHNTRESWQPILGAINEKRSIDENITYTWMCEYIKQDTPMYIYTHTQTINYHHCLACSLCADCVPICVMWSSMHIEKLNVTAVERYGYLFLFCFRRKFPLFELSCVSRSLSLSRARTSHKRTHTCKFSEIFRLSWFVIKIPFNITVVSSRSQIS